MRILLEIFILTLIATVFGDFPLSNSSLSQRTEADVAYDFQLLRFTHRRIPAQSIEGCAFHCLTDSRCKSFNYIRRKGICEINLEARDPNEATGVTWINHNGEWVTIVDGLFPAEGIEYHSRQSYQITRQDDWSRNLQCLPSPCSEGKVCSHTTKADSPSNGFSCLSYQLDKIDVMSTWTNWGSWIPCSVTCGTSSQARERYCDTRGVDWFCDGHDEERRLCSTTPCPIWSLWAVWSDCSTQTTCGVGEQKRHRTCLYGGRQNSDPNCSGDTIETKKCYTPSCKAKIRVKNDTEGFVQILTDLDLQEPKWTDVCQDNLSNDGTVQAVVCKQLGYLSAHATQPDSPNGEFTTYLSPSKCIDADQYLMECEHVWKMKNNCTKRLAVKCTVGHFRHVICERDEGKIECGGGKLLQIENAIWGKKDLNTCVGGEENVNCITDVTEEVINACNDLRDCEISPTAAKFGDPCPETQKYLEVKYYCVSAGAWSVWSSWNLCDSDGKQRRSRKRTKIDVVTQNVEDRACSPRRSGLIEPGWFDGGNNLQYRILSNIHDSFHSARMECMNLKGDILSKGLNDSAEIGNLQQVFLYHYDGYTDTIWAGVLRNCSSSDCDWRTINNDPVLDELWESNEEYQSNYQCAMFHKSSFSLIASPCEFVAPSVVVCEKRIEKFFSYTDDEASKIYLFNKNSFSMESIATTMWNMQNAAVLCREHGNGFSKDSSFFWKGSRFIPMKKNLEIAEGTEVHHYTRCSAVRGTIQTVTWADIQSTGAPKSIDNSTFKQMVFLNFKQCFHDSQRLASGVICAHFNESGSLSICTSKELCSFGLGMESGSIKESDILVSSKHADENGISFGPEEARMHWTGLSFALNSETLPKCSGWRPLEDDSRPNFTIKLGMPSKVTGVLVAKSSAELEHIQLEMRYSLDGITWFGPSYQNKPERFILKDLDETAVAQFTTSGKLPFLAVFIRFESFYNVKHSCLQFEIFGCGLDLRHDLDCHQRVKIKEYGKNGSLTDKKSVNEYTSQNYLDSQKNNIAFWIPRQTHSSHCSPTSNVARSLKECPWFEIEFFRSVAVSEISMRGMRINMKKECHVKSFVVAYHDGDSFQFYLSKIGRNPSPKRFVNRNGVSFTKHKLYNVFTNKLRIISTKWSVTACVVMSIYGCSYEELVSRFYGMSHDIRRWPSRKESSEFVVDFLCDGKEETLDECVVETKPDNDLPTLPIKLSCERKLYRLRGLPDNNRGYLQWSVSIFLHEHTGVHLIDIVSRKRWDGNEQLWRTVSTSRMGNNSASTIHWSKAHAWDYADEMRVCAAMGMEGHEISGSMMKTIAASEYASVSAKSSVFVEDSSTGKPIHYAAEKALLYNEIKSSNATVVQAWCPSRYGDYITFEFRRMFRIQGFRTLVLSKDVNERLRVENIVNNLGYEVQWSVDGKIWINVQAQDMMQKFGGVSAVEFRNLLSVRWIRLALTTYPKEYSCLSVEFSGSTLHHNWEESQHCMEPSGMGDGRIKDIDITASSILNEKYAAIYARLNEGIYLDKNIGWACLCMGELQRSQWIQVKLDKKSIVRGIITQGSTIGPYFVKSFEVAYSDDETNWIFVKGADGKAMIFKGNSDTQKSIGNHLPKPILSNYIRIYPWTFENYMVLRFELLGCAVADVQTQTQQVSVTTSSVANNKEYLLLSGLTHQWRDGLEYWIVDGNKAFGVTCENDNKLCKLGGGEIAHKFLLNERNYTEIVPHYRTFHVYTLLLGLTDYMISNLYEDDEQEILADVTSHLWYGNEPNYRFEHNTFINLNGMYDFSCNLGSVSGLCEKSVNSSVLTRNEACPPGFLEISDYCYKVLQGNELQSCQHLFDHCTNQGGASIDSLDNLSQASAKKLFDKLKISSYKATALGRQDCILDNDPLGLNYTGSISQTRSTLSCQRWDTDFPHKRNFWPVNPSEHENFCRNPDSEREGPWCYTSDPNKRWEYCDVSKCSVCAPHNAASNRYVICERPKEHFSIFTHSSSMKKLRDEKYSASSFLLDSPAWMASPGSCGVWCLHNKDQERWLQIDLSELHMVHSVILRLPQDECIISLQSFSVENINSKLSHMALKPKKITVKNYLAGKARDTEYTLQPHSDGSWVCKMTLPIIGRFVKIFFEESRDGVTNCAHVDVVGTHWNVEESVKWTKRFLQVKKHNGVDFEHILTMNSMPTMNDCAFQCLKLHSSKGCSAYTYTYENFTCKLYAYKEGGLAEELEFSPYLLQENIFENIANNRNLNNMGIVNKVPVSIVTGSQILGCFSDEKVSNIILFGNNTKTPLQCTSICFQNGYENAVVRLGGYCWCGDATISQVAEGSRNMLDICDMPCAKDTSISCGGVGHSIVYQKPVSCFRGYLNKIRGNFYCMRSAKKTYYQAEKSCLSDTSDEELLNPTVAKDVFKFVKDWILKLHAGFDISNLSVKKFSLWAGRFVDFEAGIPQWVKWSQEAPDDGQNLCVSLDVILIPGHTPLLSHGILKVVNCNKTNLYYICDLGDCDGEGRCLGSKTARHISKVSKQKAEFVSGDPSKPVTWHEAREICLRRNKDLCLAEDVCKNFDKIFISKEVEISSSKNVWVPVRDSFKDWMYVNQKNTSKCHPKWHSKRIPTTEDKPASLRNTLQGIFCCGRQNVRLPTYDLAATRISASRRSGPTTLTTRTGSSIQMTWIGHNPGTCCSDCYLAIPNSDSSQGSEFYKISNGNIFSKDVVSFELVQAPGYFLGVCDDDPLQPILNAVPWDKSTEHQYDFILSKDSQGCSRYESAAMPSFFISLDDESFVLNQLTMFNMGLSCFTTPIEIHYFEVPSMLHTWQYSKDFCILRGMDLCDGTTLCQKIGTNFPGFWFPARDYQNEWIKVFSSGVCVSHLQIYGSPLWGLHPGSCSLWDKYCLFLGKIPCCNSVEYLEDNRGITFPGLTLYPSAGHAIEYGYWEKNYIDDLLGSGDFAVEEPDNTTEEECYWSKKREGYFGYAYSTNLTCFGIGEDDFMENLRNIKLDKKEGSMKIVKIEKVDDDDEARLAILVGDGFFNGPHFGPSYFPDNLFEFTILIWYQDMTNQGGRLFTYKVSNDELMTVTLRKDPDSLCVYFCCKEMRYLIEEKPRLALWNTIGIRVVHNEGITVYVDGQRVYEETSDADVESCYLPRRGALTLGANRTDASTDGLPKFAVIFDLANFAFEEQSIMSHSASVHIDGNLISSSKLPIYTAANEFLVPKSFLMLNHWMRTDDLTYSFYISDSKWQKVVMKKNRVGMWATYTASRNYEQSCAISTRHNDPNCNVITNFQFRSYDGHISLGYMRKFFNTRYFLVPVNIGKGSFGFVSQANNTSDGIFQFYYRPDSFRLSRISKDENSVLLLNSHRHNWLIKTGICLEKLPSGFSGSTFERVHITFLSRRCIERTQTLMRSGCTAPLFKHGTFFDYLLERWRRPSLNGGIRLEHIKEMLRFAYFKAMQPDFKYYKVCFGGYNIRLLRISQKLKSVPEQEPTESMRSGMLQYYDDHFGWGGVCANNLIDTNFADVSCRELGYAGAKWVNYVNLRKPVRVTLQNPKCFGNESTLQECGKDEFKSCDWSQIAHVTCRSDHRSCGEGWTLLEDNFCVTTLGKTIKVSYFLAKNSCDSLGGMLPEFHNPLVREKLAFYLNESGLEEVWLGATVRGGEIRWLTTGDVLDMPEGIGDCVSFNKNMTMKKRLCQSEEVYEVFCVKPVICPLEYFGTECELLRCHSQKLHEVTVSCSVQNPVVRTICNYTCSGGTKFVGPETRQCIMSSEFGPIWNAVDPICDSDTSLSIVEVCEKHGACNNGICIESSSNSYKCVCDEEHYGDNCQIRNGKTTALPILAGDRCMGMGCLNYGKCILERNVSRCICLPGYFGEHCENYFHIICRSNPCMNGGSCVQMGHQGFVCRCVKGYTGKICAFSESVVGPSGCAFPFVYQRKKYYGCTNADIDKYRSLGCWNWKITPGLLKKININESRFSSNTTFPDRCFQETYEMGYDGYVVAMSQGQLICMIASKFLLKYTRHGKSVDCQNGERDNVIEAFEIIHSNVDLKWCSVDSIYVGNWIFCEPKKHDVLVQSKFTKETLSHSDPACFSRKSSNVVSKGNNTNGLLSYISEILSCVHYGKPNVLSLEKSSERESLLSVRNMHCQFPAVYQNTTYFSCFRNHTTGDENVRLCYDAEGTLVQCLGTYLQQHLYCVTDNGTPGYSLTTTFGGTMEGGTCAFPFTHKGQNITTCELGWCYTDGQRNDWVFCIQDGCVVYPRPMMSVQDTASRATTVKMTRTCSDMDHMYFGRAMTHYSCEQACMHDSDCRGYVFLPKFEVFVFENILYSYYKIPGTYQKAQMMCATIGGKLIAIDDAQIYNAVMDDLELRGVPDFQPWMDGEDCSVLSSTRQAFDQSNLLWKNAVPCESLQKFICQQESGEDVLEATSIGKSPSEIGYCIGTKEIANLKQLTVIEQEVSDSYRAWWGWKEDCVFDIYNSGEFAMAQWTEWTNRDNEYGTGDWELLKNVVRSHRCEQPLSVEARRVSDDGEVFDGDDAVTLHKHYGVSCSLSYNGGAACTDYKVRFLCKVPPSWRIFMETVTGRRWSISTFKANWIDAQDACIYQGGYLAIVNSYEMEQYLKGILAQKNFDNAVYIGIKTDLTKWVDGSFVRYHNFDDYMAHNPPRCAAMHRSLDSWEGLDCGTSQYFICEFPPLRSTAMNHFVKLGLELTASGVNLTKIGKEITTSDLEYCMELCWKGNHLSTCQFIMFKNSTCHLLPNSESLSIVQDGYYETYQKKNSGVECHRSIIGNLQSLYITMSHIFGVDHEVQQYIHRDAYESYCVKLNSGGGEIALHIDFTCEINITMISFDVRQEGSSLPYDAFTFIQVVYDSGNGDWLSLDTDIIKGKVFHPLEVPVIAHYLNMSILYAARTTGEKQHVVCLYFDIAGCPLQPHALNQYPHGYYPPTTEENEEPILEDAVTVRCND